LIFGRKRELIIRGAYDVLPGEIEELLSERLAVRGSPSLGLRIRSSARTSAPRSRSRRVPV